MPTSKTQIPSYVDRSGFLTWGTAWVCFMSLPISATAMDRCREDSSLGDTTGPDQNKMVKTQNDSRHSPLTN